MQFFITLNSKNLFCFIFLFFFHVVGFCGSQRIAFERMGKEVYTLTQNGEMRNLYPQLHKILHKIHIDPSYSSSNNVQGNFGWIFRGFEKMRSNRVMNFTLKFEF